MLNINLFGEDKGSNPEIIPNLNVVDWKYIEWRQRQFELDNLRKYLDKISKEVGKLKISGEDATGKIKRSEECKQSIETKDAEVQASKDLLYSKLDLIGNLVHDSVPVDNDEANNLVVRTRGEKMTERKLKNHVELVELLGIADLKKGANVVGGRGFYLKGVGVLLNQGLISFSFAFLGNQNYTLLQTPFFMRKYIMETCSQLAQFDEDLYTKSQVREMIATTEHQLCAYHLYYWIHPTQRPLRYAGYSTCFCKEAGSHGRDTLEQFYMTSQNATDSWEMHEEMIKNSEDFYKDLHLPYQVVSIISGALNDAAAKKYDLEAHFPASNKEDGVEIPTTLRPFMGGLSYIPFQTPPIVEGKGKKK
ncbi:hypothetical protein MKX03_012808 [Papaver bracteatum]|nr:hypothetical protein MKX03_012808 [Papaver bracteatum]